MADWMVTLLVALIASAPGFVAIVMQAKSRKTETRRSDAESGKSDAEAVEAVSQAALTLVAPLRQRVIELEVLVQEKTARLDTLTAYVEYMENGVHTLVGQLAMNGHRATWRLMTLDQFRVQRVTIGTEKNHDAAQ